MPAGLTIPVLQPMLTHVAQQASRTQFPTFSSPLRPLSSTPGFHLTFYFSETHMGPT